MQGGGDTRRRLASLAPQERRLLTVLGFTFPPNQYDLTLAGLALPQIQAGIVLALPETAGRELEDISPQGEAS